MTKRRYKNGLKNRKSKRSPLTRPRVADFFKNHNTQRALLIIIIARASGKQKEAFTVN
jgi:hypothetical protein